MIVPIEVTTDARAILARYQVQRKGATHLQVVLCHWGSQYVTWTYNKQTAGYGHGHYHGPDLQEAVRDFAERVLREEHAQL